MSVMAYQITEYSTVASTALSDNKGNKQTLALDMKSFVIIIPDFMRLPTVKPLA